MGQEFAIIDQSMIDWINQQHMFFVATAPLAGDGLLNCSPKGLDTFSVIDTNTVAYLDLTGSGAETIAHLKENGRIVIMFCAFTGPAKIVRLHGTGSVIETSHPDFAALKAKFPDLKGIRSIIRIAVKRISDSCGYGVPQYDFKRERDSLLKYAENLGEDGLRDYRKQKNQHSLDGLPALTVEEG